MVKIGVLALQGSVEEHVASLSKIENIECIKIKNPNDLKNISGLILPGGESTTIGKLIRIMGLYHPIIEKIKAGMPVWGTCAGMILLAKKIIGEETVHLGLMDIEVKRNAYGSQLDSFYCTKTISKISNKPIPLVFIRAPWVDKVSDDVEILLEIDGRIVAAKEKNMIVTSFHPELTEDLSFHKYFVSKAQEHDKLLHRNSKMPQKIRGSI